MIVKELNLEATIVKFYDNSICENSASTQKNIDLVVKELLEKYIVSNNCNLCQM